MNRLGTFNPPELRQFQNATDSYEILTDNSAAMIQISMIHLLLNRLA